MTAGGIHQVDTSPGNTVSGVDNLAEAIAQQEGYYVAGSLPNRTNNPGDIGTYGGNVGIYSDPGDGWDALNSYITTKAQANPTWDFYDFSHYYLTGNTMGTPGANQNPDAYAEEPWSTTWASIRRRLFQALCGGANMPTGLKNSPSIGPGLAQSQPRKAINFTIPLISPGTNVPIMFPGLIVPEGLSVSLRGSTAAGVNVGIARVGMNREELQSGGGRIITPDTEILFPVDHMAQIWAVFANATDGLIATISGVPIG